ncbi:MAG: VTT domain-containing protein, partial [Rhizobacter sp.]|nr:VTT domain-containing protein [Rhizobacter sp.]
MRTVLSSLAMEEPARSASAATGLVVLRWGLFCVLLLAFILVPFVLLEGRMNALVQGTLQASHSLWWITLAVVLFLLADIVLPIPSSFVLSTTGYLLGTTLGAAVGFVGLSCAALCGYALGRYAGGPVAQRVVGRAQLERFSGLSRRHGDALLVAFRAMPVLAEATTILAGIARMPMWRFMLVVSIGNFVVALVYAWIGAVSARQSSFLFASVASIVLPLLIVLAMRRAARPPAT